MAEPPQKADAETPESPPDAKRRKTDALVCGRVCIVLTADDEVTETNPKLDDVDFDMSLNFIIKMVEGDVALLTPAEKKYASIQVFSFAK